MITHKIDSRFFLKKVGENIEFYRLHKKQTIKQMASLLGMSPSGYRNIEKGDTEIGITKLFLISKIFQVELPQILEDKNNIEVNHNSDEAYKLCIQQYKNENIFLKRQIELLNQILAKDSNFSG